MSAPRVVRVSARGVAALAFVLAGAAARSAAQPAWENVGPWVQGDVLAVAVDPRTPQIVYVGSSSGLFKSTNSGITWNPSGLGLDSGPVTAIAIDPKRTTTLFAGTRNGIYRSKDSAATWQLVSEQASVIVGGFAIHPIQSIAFAAVLNGGPSPGGVTLGTLYQTTDGGSSWRRMTIAPMSPAPYGVWIDPFNSSRVFVGTTLGVYRSDDIGAHWSLKLSERTFSISLDPATAGVLYAGTDAVGASAVERSVDAGDHWAPIAATLPAGDLVRAVAQVPGPPATLYAANGAGLFKTINGGASWTPAATGVQGLVSVLVPFGAPENSVYVGSDAGLFKVQTISASAVALDSPFAAVGVSSFVSIPGKGAALYAGSAGFGDFSGVYRSSGGSVWTRINGNLPDTNVVALAMSPQVPAGCPAPCDTEPPLYAGTASGVFKTSDRGAHWAGANRGLPGRNVRSLLVDPLDPDTIYVVLNNQGVAKSVDAGSNWTPVNVGLASFAVSALAVDPTTPATLYAAAGGDVYKTTDGAAHWALQQQADLAAPAVSFSVAPTAPATVYAATQAGPYRSTDGGAHWTALDVGIDSVIGPFPPSQLSVAADPRSASIVFAGSAADGAFRSGSAGADWETLDAGLPREAHASAFSYPELLALDWDRTNRTTLTAATGFGLFSIRPGPVTSVCAPADDTLCLNGGRFRLKVAWEAANLGTSGIGHAVPLTADTGYFWFFQPTNVELMIKVLDARALNGRFWVFYGALSDVRYDITVTDTETGEERVYHNPQGNLASVADIAAFPVTSSVAVPSSAALEEALARETAGFDTLAAMFAPEAAPAAPAACTGTPAALCLSANRFRVEVEWHARHLGTSGVGQAVPLTSDTGYFWFFQATNVELVVKVLDARSFSGHFWVFYGALSNVEYTIRVTDTVTGDVKTYFNPQDRLASVADTAAF